MLYIDSKIEKRWEMMKRDDKRGWGVFMPLFQHSPTLANILPAVHHFIPSAYNTVFLEFSYRGPPWDLSLWDVGRPCLTSAGACASLLHCKTSKWDGNRGLAFLSLSCLRATTPQALGSFLILFLVIHISVALFLSRIAFRFARLALIFAKASSLVMSDGWCRSFPILY